MYKNGFLKYAVMFNMFGGIVNFNDETGDTGSTSGSDQPGGTIDSGPDSDKMGGDADSDRQDTLNLGDKDDKGSAEGDGANDSGSNDQDTKGTPNYDERFSALESNFSKLFDALNKNTNSGDDSTGGDKSADLGDLSGLEHEDLVAMMAENPSEFISKLTGVIEKSVTDRVVTQTQNEQFSKAVESTIDTYADANPDFEKMWDKGELQTFMEKNPGHNAISAHMALTMENRIAEAKKQGADEAIKNFRTKSANQVLNGGHGIPPSQKDAALKNPEKFGGRAAVIAQRAGIV